MGCSRSAYSEACQRHDHPARTGKAPPTKQSPPKATVRPLVKPVVFLVDDDPQVRGFLASQLRLEELDLLAFAGAEEALIALRDARPDLIVTDVEMHGMDGLALCRRIRSDPKLAGLPIILISGRRIETDDQIEGMDHGADDYLLKPVPVKVLASRIRSLLRHVAWIAARSHVLAWDVGQLDLAGRIATVQGVPIELTRKEFDLLAVLLQRRGEVVAHRELLDQVWGIDPARTVDTDSLKTHVSSLRHKLGPATGDRIESVRGVGYRFIP